LAEDNIGFITDFNMNYWINLNTF